jgi:PncC family amidohydrolase
METDHLVAVTRRLDRRTVAVAESCTAGRQAAALAAGEGATDWFRGGVVAYQVSVKRALLDVSVASVYCEEAAAQMAAGVATLLDAHVAVGTSGVAGDDPIEGVEPGTVFVATLVDGDCLARTYRFTGDAAQVCQRATASALAQLAEHLGPRWS